jgi:hypothetical protein
LLAEFVPKETPAQLRDLAGLPSASLSLKSPIPINL